MRILEICVDLDGGGIDRYLYNYCSRIQGISFDFAIVDNKKDGILEPGLRALGCQIYRVPRISKGAKENYLALKKIMTDKHYDAVHVHLGYKGFSALRCAKACGIKTRVVHAHIANVPESRKQRLIRAACTRLTKHYATDLAACGIEAAKWVWGEKAYAAGKVAVQNNAIETQKYAYDPALREAYRAQLQIPQDTLVVGHVGRLCDQKNQLRLLDIFAAIHEKQPDSCLLLIGRGDQEEDVKKKIRQLQLDSAVRLLGVRDDVPALLNAMDVFVFPSKYEGLPFTLIETQCNGLMAVSSDAVTAQVKVSPCVQFLRLEDTDNLWADRALAAAKQGHAPEAREDVISAGYDIDTEAMKLKNYYTERVELRQDEHSKKTRK